MFIPFDRQIIALLSTNVKQKFSSVILDGKWNVIFLFECLLLVSLNFTLYIYLKIINCSVFYCSVLI